MKRRLLSLTIAVLLGTAASAGAQQAFNSPEEATTALVAALKADDAKAIAAILGPDGRDIISSGDPVADADIRKDFLAAYDEKHRIEIQGEEAFLDVGTDDYPVPLPLMRTDGKWHFDTAAGLDEILYRRIGRNELDAIQACLAFVDAQDEYADKDRTGAGPGVYAQRIVSQPGRKDGLYWTAAQNEEQSPLGPLVASATKQGYRVGDSPAPFHGYYFKVLTKQGAAAPGGELEYIVKGKMIGGFALVAYPAEYDNSGVMTFIVSHAGVVYEKDLGPDTAKLAERMTSFNPDSTWHKVTDTAPAH